MATKDGDNTLLYVGLAIAAWWLWKNKGPQKPSGDGRAGQPMPGVIVGATPPGYSLPPLQLAPPVAKTFPGGFHPGPDYE